MAIENIPINSGTGPQIAVDLVGTDNYQIVKIVQAPDGSAGVLSSAFTVTGSVSVLNTPTVTVSNNPMVITGSVGVGTITVSSGSFSIVNTPTVTATISNSPVVTATISNAVLAISGTVTALPSGTQNVAIQGTPVISGTVNVAGVASVTGNLTTVGAVSTVTGTVVCTGTMGVNLLQRLDATNDAILIYGAQTGSSVNKPVLVSTSGGLFIASGGGGGAQYGVDTTSMNNTATGTIILAMQSGATTARSIAVTTTGAVQSFIIGTPVVTGAFVGTAHASRWNAFAVMTTSNAAAVIVKTSGAHTLYVTDLMLSVDVPMTLGLYSSSGGTKLLECYFATKGGMVFPMTSPMVLTSAQSLVMQNGASGSAACYAAGYTVT